MNYDEKRKEYLEGVKNIFPGLRFKFGTAVFNPEKSTGPTSGKIELNGQFLNEEALKDGPVQFMHYTSLNSAMNILNSGNVRLYNCFNLNDPNEINYFLDQYPIKFEAKEIKQYKREHFILSGCKYTDESDEDYNLWRLYGDSGKGVGIVFEIDDKIKNWSHLFLQHVSYGKADNKTTEFLNYHVEFNKKHNLFQNKPAFFSLLATAVKNELWSIEKEFRIVVKCPFNQRTLKDENRILASNPLIGETIKHEIKSDGKMVSYVELPLSFTAHKGKDMKVQLEDGKTVDLHDYVPNLKIKEIIFGPNNPLKMSDVVHYMNWKSSELDYIFKFRESSIKF